MKFIRLGKIIFLLFIVFSTFGCKDKDENITIKYIIGEETYTYETINGILTIDDLPKIDNIKYIGLYYDSNYKNEYKNEKLNKDDIIYVKYVPKYTITYYINDAKYVIEVNENVFSITDIPDYKNYFIEGLYYDSSFTTEFDGNLNSDVILYAKCKKSYKVVANFDNDKSYEINIPCDVGVLLIDDLPKIDNYEVLGLYLDSEYKEKFDYYLNGDTIIYVKGRPSYKLTLIYENNTRKGMFINKNVLTIGDIKNNNEPLDDYEYNYYDLYYDVNYENKFDGVLDSDITLYVKREKINNITLVYDKENIKNFKTDKKFITINDIPYKKGYEILGLYTDDKKKNIFDGVIKSDLTLYVDFKKYDEVLTFNDYLVKNFNIAIDDINKIGFVTVDSLFGREQFLNDPNNIQKIIKYFDFDYGYNTKSFNTNKDVVKIHIYVDDKKITTFDITIDGEFLSRNSYYSCLVRLDYTSLREELYYLYTYIEEKEDTRRFTLSTRPKINLYSIRLVFDDGAIRDVLTNKSTFDLTNVPKIKNYKVLGLFLDKDFEKPFDGNITNENLILYVKGEYTYTVTIIYSDNLEEETININGTRFLFDDIVKKSGYNYYGIYTNFQLTKEHNGEVVRDIKLYVKRRTIKKVKFVSDIAIDEFETDKDNISLSDVKPIEGYEILGIYSDPDYTSEFNEKLVNDITLYVKTKKWDNTYKLEDVFKRIHNDLNTNYYSDILEIKFSLIIYSYVSKTINDKNSLNELLNIFNLEFCDKDYFDYPYESVPYTYQINLIYENYIIALKLHNSGHLSFVLFYKVGDEYDSETEFVEYSHVCLSKLNYYDTVNKLLSLYQK